MLLGHLGADAAMSSRDVAAGEVAPSIVIVIACEQRVGELERPGSEMSKPSSGRKPTRSR